MAVYIPGNGKGGDSAPEGRPAKARETLALFKNFSF
jgi:hypothetical protein